MRDGLVTTSTEPEFAALWPSASALSTAWVDIDGASHSASRVTLTGPLAALARLSGPNSGVAEVENAIVRFLVDAAHDAAGPRGATWYELRPVAFGDLPHDIGRAIGYIFPPGEPLFRATSARDFYEARIDPCDLAAYIMQTMEGGTNDHAAKLLRPDTLLKRAALAFAQGDPQFAFDRAPESLWPLIAAYRAQAACDENGAENWPPLVEAAHALGMQVAPPTVDRTAGRPVPGTGNYPNWRAACNDVRAKIAQRLGQFK